MSGLAENPLIPSKVLYDSWSCGRRWGGWVLWMCFVCDRQQVTKWWFNFSQRSPSFPPHTAHIQRWTVSFLTHSYLLCQEGSGGSCSQTCTQILLSQVKGCCVCPRSRLPTLENFLLCQLSPRSGNAFILCWHPHHFNPMFIARDIPSYFCGS